MTLTNLDPPSHDLFAVHVRELLLPPLVCLGEEAWQGPGEQEAGKAQAGSAYNTSQ